MLLSTFFYALISILTTYSYDLEPEVDGLLLIWVMTGVTLVQMSFMINKNAKEVLYSCIKKEEITPIAVKSVSGVFGTMVLLVCLKYI